MKNILIAFTLFTVLACTVTNKKTMVGSTYDSTADIDLFLSTGEESVENQVLDRLKSHNVDSAQIKQILRATLSASSQNSRGLQSNLKIKIKQKRYSYALYVPDLVSPDMPMIVIMHGMGGSGANTIQAWIDRLGDKFVILCPTYPMGAWWSQNAENFVLQLVNEIQTNYPIDPNRIFLSGLSNGAIGAYMMGMFYPDRFAGIIPIAGGITKRLMSFLVNLNNTSLYIIQGEFDPVFPIALVRRTYKILSDFKSPVIYREHKERGAAHGGHFLPESEVPALIEWLTKQKRNISPKVIRITREKNHMNRFFGQELVKV
jgi:predicted peptidase